jgi:hypothetical protein
VAKMQKIKLKTVKWHPKINRICQIPKEGLEFAMLSDRYEQLNQLVWCRDFMQDIIWSYVNKQPIDIYGFKYDPNNAPHPSTKNLKLLITNFKDADFGNKLINGTLPLIHSVEERLKIKKTVLEKCSTPPTVYRKSGVWILKASKRWIKSPPMLSFYTLLVRIGMVHNKKDTLEDTIKKIKNGSTKTYYDQFFRDREMLDNAEDGIKRIMKNSDRGIFPANISKNYPITYWDSNSKLRMNVYLIHDRCGIVGFSGGLTKLYFSCWKNIG